MRVQITRKRTKLCADHFPIARHIARGLLACIVLALSGPHATICRAQGAIQFNVTFDGPPLQPAGTAYSVREYYESGVLFTPIYSSFGRVGGGSQRRPENGTAYLQAALTDSLRFSLTNGSLFSLISVDLAEYSTLVPDPVTVRFIGYRLDGTTVTADFTTDGIRNGVNP